MCVPVVIAFQQLIVALPGDDADAGPLGLIWVLAVIALGWAAAERRSALAWVLLLAFCALALAWSLLYGIENGYDPAAYPYMLLGGIALGLLLSPASLDYLRD